MGSVWNTSVKVIHTVEKNLEAKKTMEALDQRKQGFLCPEKRGVPSNYEAPLLLLISVNQVGEAYTQQDEARCA